VCASNIHRSLHAKLCSSITLYSSVLTRFQPFIHRHPHLKAMSKLIELTRIKDCTRETFEKWFNTYCKMTTSFKAASHNICNIDETGFQMGDSARNYIIIDKQLRTTGYVEKSSKMENICVIECGCQDGTVLLPLINFEGKNLQST
jgi:hypothetical protein